MNPLHTPKWSQNSEHFRRFKRVFLLLTIWISVSLVLVFVRISHPAFGIQGDLPLHYHITRTFVRSLSEGDPFPRWAGLLDGGNGDALFTFYPQLAYLTSAILITASSIDVLTSLKIVLIFTLILAQAGAYCLARRFFAPGRSIAVALIYVLLPSYPLIALHRGFVPNAIALGFAPLALLGAHRLLTDSRSARGNAIFILGVSAVILTHVITTYLCGIVIILMVLSYLREIEWWRMARLAIAGCAVFALTAFFIIPQQIEMSWVKVGLQLVEQDYRNYLLFAKPQDSSEYRRVWAGLNEVVSYITITQTLMAILLGLAARPLFRAGDKRSGEAAVVRFGIAITAFGLIISLPFSDPIWRYLPGLKYVQFPWRFQPFVSLGCGLMAAAVPGAWRALKPFSRALIAGALSWIVGANLLFTGFLLRLNAPNVTRAQVVKHLNAPDVGPTSMAEARQIQSEDELKYLAYTGNQIYFRPKGADLIFYPPASMPGTLSFIRGQGRVISEKIKIAQREFVVESIEPSQVRLETYHYPHWVARLDDREVAIVPEQASGRMLVDLPAGRHRLSFKFEVHDIYERAAGVISVISWILFGGWLALKLYRRPVRKPGS